MTKFQQKVYEIVSEIPKGKVMTYGQIAQKLGCRSAQAVGQALKRNPYAPKVPCHRVVAKDLTLGGFKGVFEGTEINQKRLLLKAEGVLFISENLIHPSSLFSKG